MTDRTPGELEREADQIRAGIAETAEALQDRMSPGKMIDEFMGYMKDSDGSLALDNLRRQARDNPMALAMIGSGIAWLMMGDGGGHRRGAAGRADHGEFASDDPLRATLRPAAPGAGYAGHDPAEPAGVRSHDHGGDGSDGMRDKADALSGRARSTAGHASDRVRDAAEDAAERARRMRDDASHRAHSAADDMRDMADRGRRSLMDALDREPLVLGSIGVAVGAALGALIPNTRFENESFGKSRDALMRDADHAVDRAAEKARNVASEAVHAAKDASKAEGLVVEGEPVAERVGNVAKAGLSAGKDATEREMDRDETAGSRRPGSAPAGGGGA